MDNTLIQSAANELFLALTERTTVAPLRERYPNITVDDAYQISLGILSKRLAQGEKVIGKKIGLTSKAVQDMLKVDQPDFGFLTDKMIFTDEVPLTGNLIQPKAEGEIAFVMKKQLIGPGVTEADVLAATEAVMPCFEVVDSRIADWKITLEDTVADNASCGVFALNDKAAVDPKALDLPNCEMIVKKNGQFLSRGLGSAALGNPLTCVAWLANVMGAYGVSLNPGDIILAGSLVPLEPVVAGDNMSLTISSIGDLSINFV
ncbi:fumarylacetoacetate hydrolase family protein [Haliea salexigens]|uniref:fumarylacetoacetate hydrolase family protein n=1 Tax=Haliea salexigens TaxID=287487 RepID=UPI00048660FA|nr:fumarylacetoacetate hydrolase family protein [Haliea salexigens]